MLHRCTNYKVCARITDLAGNTPLYRESASFLYDITDPNAAMALSWNEGATHDSHTLNASWSVSSSTDISSQTLSIHSNSSCSDLVGIDNTYSNNTTNADTVTVSSDGAYYFQITTEDNAGNTVVSACSAAMSDI